MAAAPGGCELTAPPSAGRTFTRERRVRLGDASPAGRLRLDALARFAQDAASDDSRDAALPDADGWVVRRTTALVHRFPAYDEWLALRTWCSGTGARWADRRTTITGSAGGHVEMVTLWVAIDAATARPRALGPSFAERYGASAAGRTVSPRLSLPEPPAGDAAPARRPWPLRFRDFDVLGHVNNAAYWEPIEELLADRRDLRAPLRVELEHVRPLERGAACDLVHAATADGGLAVWLVSPAAVVHAAAVVRMAS